MKTIKIIDSKDVKTSELIAEVKKICDVYIYDDKDVDTQFPAPEETLEVECEDNIESDKTHIGKSYDVFISEDKKYLNLRQYLFLFIAKYKATGKYLDVKGWTHTSSLWSGGRVVGGSWDPDGRKLYLSFGFRDYRNSDYGPREQISVRILPSSLKTSTLEKSDNKEKENEEAIEICKRAGLTVTKIY